MTGDRIGSLPADVATLLSDPPATAKKLLELLVTWPGPDPDHVLVVEALRVFAVTWDPLEWRGVRPDYFAIANEDADGREFCVYLATWRLWGLAEERDTTLAAVLGEVALTALTGKAAGDPPSPPPVIIPVSPAWEDIGLGAITDIVAAAFGRVDLDRSLVVLSPLDQKHRGCPACAGERFGYPAGLMEAQRIMCPTHRGAAQDVIDSRIRRAELSNRRGWRAIIHASMRLRLPHLPDGLLGRLLATGVDTPFRKPGPEHLVERASCVIAAAAAFAGRGRDLATALDDGDEAAWQYPDWLTGLVFDLGRAGLVTEAEQVADALGAVDIDLRRLLDGDLPMVLAQAGAADRARERIDAALARWPDDFWVRVHAGDALLAIGDTDGAAAHFTVALAMAERSRDHRDKRDVLQRLRAVREPTERPARKGSRRGGQTKGKRR